jgi:hypothetical protein
VLEENSIPTEGLGVALRDALLRQPFRLLVDGDDDLDSAVRFEGICVLLDLQRGAAVAHEIFVTADESTFDPAHYPDRTVALIIQPMLPERVGAYLEQSCPDVAGALVPKLRETALFDLAGVPWLLNRMIENSRQGVTITCRTAMLERFVRDGLAVLGGPAGARSRAEEALTKIAWTLQSSRRASLPAAETYRILADVRGHRDFPLDGHTGDAAARPRRRLRGPRSTESRCGSAGRRDVVAFRRAMWGRPSHEDQLRWSITQTSTLAFPGQRPPSP